MQVLRVDSNPGVCQALCKACVLIRKVVANHQMVIRLTLPRLSILERFFDYLWITLFFAASYLSVFVTLLKSCYTASPMFLDLTA